jgi:hypothetical protein
MLEPLLSLHFVAIALIIIVLSTTVALLCAYLHRQLLQVFAGEWLHEHVYCPTTRTFILLVMTLLLFPLMNEDVDYAQVGQLFLSREYLTNMLNILLVSGLVITFVPLLNHPALAMPILGCIATAILFHHYFAQFPGTEPDWIPGIAATIKILVLISILFWLGQMLIEQLACYFDQRFFVTGSKEIVTDIVYLILQIPVMLAYAAGLQASVAVTNP